MQNLSDFPIGLLMLLVWAAVWSIGGIWIIRAAFRLQPREQLVAGIAVGLVIENLLANWLARLMPVAPDAWTAALIILAFGFALKIRQGWRNLIQIKLFPAQIILFVLILGTAVQIGRGMPIYDDFAHLPETSMMAAGYIPPVFSLNPSIPYGYHYFLMLFAAQISRVGQIYVWTALDLARGLSFALAVMLAGLFTWRLAGSRLAGWLGGAFMAFASGTRWLLLLLPPRALSWLSSGVNMVGSGKASGENLAAALLNSWASTSGPIPFPFAFVNGIIYPGTLNLFNIAGLMTACISLLLLLSFNRWKNAWAGVVSALLIAATGLLVEAEVALFAAAWLIIFLVWRFTHRKIKTPNQLGAWMWTAGAGTLLALLQGGAWTDMLTGWVQRLFMNTGPFSYQTIQFEFAWPPGVVSQQLGVLSFFNPRQLIVALAELGPMLLVLPFLVIWALKAYRSGRWLEAAVIISGVMTTGMIFVHFAGVTGVENTARLFSFMELCKLFAVPVGWVVFRKIKAVGLSLAFATMFAGIFILGVDLAAMQKPVTSDFLTSLDVRVMQKYWNRLPPGAMVFDWNPNRSAVLFARPVNSSTSWYSKKPEWEDLASNPEISQLQAAGYEYIYFDQKSWNNLQPDQRMQFEQTCAHLMDEEIDSGGMVFRRLVDLTECASP